mgnify:FL=1
MQTYLLLLSLFISAIFVAKRHTKYFFARRRKIISSIFYKKFAEPAFAQQKKLQPQLKPFLLFNICLHQQCICKIFLLSIFIVRSALMA